MRSIKLSSAVGAAATLLALAPAGALAAPSHPRLDPKHSGPSGCRINIRVAPRSVGAGQAALAYGQLKCGISNSDSEQTVTLYEHSEGSPGFTTDGTATSDKNGFYSLTTGPETTDTEFYAVADEAQSGKRALQVSAQVTLNGPAETTQLLTGRKHQVIFTGTVSPFEAGATVVLQRQNALTGNDWHRIEAGVVKAGGVYSIAHTFVVPGDSNIRVLVRSNRRVIASASNELNYVISQTQNPNLTIASSADPIPYGSSVTIGGTVAGGKATSVTLLAHSASQTGFAPVAVVNTDSSGNYTFPAQSPLVSTFYRVKDSTTGSAVLYEGVKDVLTAEASATSLPAGGTLTFSGTVSPDRSGHVIYLERENASGTGFHVVDVAVIQPGATATESTYTIPYQVYTQGTNVFRVRIPGDDQNGGAFSTPFSVVVTAPAPSTLTPEAPNNSPAISQGQV
jgi:hypothetical protein